MKSLWQTAEYSLLDHRRYEDILELKVDSLEERLQTEINNWLQHVHQTEDHGFTNKFSSITQQEDDDLDDA